LRTEIFQNWWKIRVFQVFFLILGANLRLWVKNGDWYVNMRDMGNAGKIKTSKNEHKLKGIGYKLVKNARFLGIN